MNSRRNSLHGRNRVVRPSRRHGSLGHRSRQALLRRLPASTGRVPKQPCPTLPTQGGGHHCQGRDRLPHSQMKEGSRSAILFGWFDVLPNVRWAGSPSRWQSSAPSAAARTGWSRCSRRPARELGFCSSSPSLSFGRFPTRSPPQSWPPQSLRRAATWCGSGGRWDRSGAFSMGGGAGSTRWWTRRATRCCSQPISPNSWCHSAGATCWRGARSRGGASRQSWSSPSPS